MADNRFVKDPRPADGGGPKKAGREGRAHRGGKAQGREAQADDKLNVAPPAGGALAKLTEELAEKIPDKVEDLQADQIPWNNPHWHPAHGGIYRNVTLHVIDPLHISLPLYSFLQTEGPYVYATDISDELGEDRRRRARSRTAASEAADVEVVAEVKDRDGKTVLTLKDAATARRRGRSGRSRSSGDAGQPAALGAGLPVPVPRGRARCARRARRSTRPRSRSASAP